MLLSTPTTMTMSFTESAVEREGAARAGGSESGVSASERQWVREPVTENVCVCVLPLLHSERVEDELFPSALPRIYFFPLEGTSASYVGERLRLHAGPQQRGRSRRVPPPPPAQLQAAQARRRRSGNENKEE